VQDTAEQVLARLERYVASRPAPPPVRPLYRTGMPFALAPPDVSRTAPSIAALPRVAATDTLVPARRGPRESGTRFIPVAVAIALSASSCALAVLLFVLLDPGVAIVAALALILAAVVGQTRRVPFASAWTTGLVVAVLIVRFS
jgi:prepilin signal peptidase PulO-like enzyme (type II secretory pathway)